MNNSLKRCLYTILVLICTLQCGGRPESPLIADLNINEFAAENTVLPDPNGKSASWVELFNNSRNDINLNHYAISIDTLEKLTYNLPDKILGSGEYVIIYFSGGSSTINEIHTPFKLTTKTHYILLLKSETILDNLSFYFPPDMNESIGRNPVNPVEWIHYPQNKVTAAAENHKPGLWKKIVNKTQFEPRDSSPNASLVYDNKIWVLAGYRFTGTDWESRSDVWSSVDGSYWELKNANPPFDPYSSFIVFKNKMWAFNSAGAYSSSDGITWQNEAPNSFPGGYGARITIFKGQLWFCSETLIGKSDDGIHWETVLSEMPWQGQRIWPGFLEHNGKLFFFGGGINYLTGTDYYYNDVWSSTDGIHWELLTAKAEWAGRFWFSYISFDNKIWLMGGWNYHNDSNSENGNQNDVWVSEDGRNWMQLSDNDQWPNRHSQLTWIKNNALYISSGYGGGGTARMYNDIWVCEDKLDRKLNEVLTFPDTLTYGDHFALEGNSHATFESSDQEILLIEEDTVTALNTGTIKLKIKIDGDQQYYPFSAEKSITIIPKKLKAIVMDTLRRFGEPNPEFKIEYDGALPKDLFEITQTVKINTPIDQLTSPGKYEVNIAAVQLKNYNVIGIPGTLTIIPEEKIVIFPNPLHQKFSVLFAFQPGKADFIEIYNLQGQLLERHTLGNANDHAINLRTSLPPGVYVYRVQNHQHIFSGRLIAK